MVMWMGETLPRGCITGWNMDSQSWEITVCVGSYHISVHVVVMLTQHVSMAAAGMGIGMTVYNTLTHPEFRKDPHKAARDVWKGSG